VWKGAISVEFSDSRELRRFLDLAACNQHAGFASRVSRSRSRLSTSRAPRAIEVRVAIDDENAALANRWQVVPTWQQCKPTGVPMASIQPKAARRPHHAGVKSGVNGAGREQHNGGPVPVLADIGLARRLYRSLPTVASRGPQKRQPAAVSLMLELMPREPPVTVADLMVLLRAAEPRPPRPPAILRA
jgi:hypothetical protein